MYVDADEAPYSVTLATWLDDEAVVEHAANSTTTAVFEAAATVTTDERMTPLFALSCTLFGIISIGILGTWAIIIHTFFADCCRRKWRRYQRRRKIAQRHLIQQQKQQRYYKAVMDEQRKISSAGSSNSINGNNLQQQALMMRPLGNLSPGNNSPRSASNELMVPVVGAKSGPHHHLLVQQASWTMDESDTDNDELYNEEDELEQYKNIHNNESRRTSQSSHSAAGESKRGVSVINELIAGSLPGAAIMITQSHTPQPAPQPQRVAAAPTHLPKISTLPSSLERALPGPPPPAAVPLQRQRAPPLGRCVPTVTIEDYDEAASRGRPDYV